MLVHTQEEAEKAGHTYIGTEHLLLGLLGEPDCLAAKVLWALGISTDPVRAALEQILGSSAPPNNVQIVPTTRVKRAIELAFEDAQKRGTDHVGSEHLLLGVMVEGDGIAAHVLHDLGIGEKKVREELDRQRSGGGGES